MLQASYRCPDGPKSIVRRLVCHRLSGGGLLRWSYEPRSQEELVDPTVTAHGTVDKTNSCKLGNAVNTQTTTTLGSKTDRRQGYGGRGEGTAAARG